MVVMLRTYFFATGWLAQNKPPPKQRNRSHFVFPTYQLMFQVYGNGTVARNCSEKNEKNISKTPFLRSRGGTGNLLVTPVRLGVLGFLNHPFLTDKEPLETDKWRCWGTRHVARHDVTPGFFFWNFSEKKSSLFFKENFMADTCFILNISSQRKRHLYSSGIF